MIVGVTVSVNGVQIRLTAERWFHISQNHPELAGLTYEILDVIQNPNLILAGEKGELFAIRDYGRKFLVVVYKEMKEDGFIITAFLTSKLKGLIKRKIIWTKKF